MKENDSSPRTDRGTKRYLKRLQEEREAEDLIKAFDEEQLEESETIDDREDRTRPL